MKKISELGLELIELKDQVLLVAKSEICVGDYITDKFRVWKWNDDCSVLGRKKVISATKSLEGLPLLVIEDEVDSIVESEFKIKHPSDETHWKKALWKDGYATAKQTYKFTEEDLRKALRMMTQGSILDDKYYPVFTEDEIIQSLVKKELYIEVERMPQSRFITTAMHKYQPKITNNKIKAVWK